jgi:LPXTG-site transpeptidase (sortase) family protein
LVIAALIYVAIADDGSADPLAAASRYSGDPGVIYERPIIVTPTPSPTPTAAAVAEPPFRNAPYHMVIDRIGVNAPVFTYGLDANAVPQVPLNAWDVAWYDFSSLPGGGGNAVFAGHVTWSGQAVFYNLNQLVPGDGIVLQGEDGKQLHYTVTESFLVDPADPAALAVMGPADSDMITIITCDGSFFYTGDPVFRGDYTHRRVVRAELTAFNVVSAEQPTAPGG